MIVSRADWGARPARSRRVIDTPTPRLWLHHSAGALDAGGNGVWWDDVRGIQDFHMRPKSQGGRGWSDIAYSFLIAGGLVWEGRGVGIAGGHTAGDNSNSHGICVIGNYETMRPHQRDLVALAWLVRHGREQGWWGELTGPHRDAPGASTACCGRHLIACIPDVRRMAAVSPPTPPTLEDDMYDQQARDELIARIDELRTESDANWARLVGLEQFAAWAGPVLAEIAGRSGVQVDAAEVARLVLAGLGDVDLTDEQVRVIIDAIPGQVKRALREGTG